MRRTCTILLISALSLFSAHAKDGYGVSCWTGWNPKELSRDQCPELRNVPLILKWNSLEPSSGTYLFDQKVTDFLKEAHQQDLYVFIKIWVGPACPEWMYEKGVPLVKTDREFNALGKPTDSQSRYPYYLDPKHKKFFFALIDAFGEYVSNLPPELRNRILFVQSCEGSTGDGGPYKGNPFDKKYDITKEAWNEYRIETWAQYLKAFPTIPIAVNSDANTEIETQWLLDHMKVIGLKHGMFSHGYVVSDNNTRMKKFDALTAEAKKRGKPVITRGEMDGELFVMGWASKNVPQTLYWSGFLATHCRLDVWNIPSKALTDPANRPAFQFFNRYAGENDPATAPFAFCALRDGLDASDFDRFPASKFGGKPGQKNNLERYLKIAKAYEKQGARMEDPEKVMGGGMINRKSSGVNDVGWETLDNNSRFLTQINPGSGDIGLWNLDQSIYGRFARSFDHRTGKKQMSFRLHEEFIAQEMKIHVTYLDKGRGEWTLSTGKTTALSVKNAGSGNWKVASVSVDGSALDSWELTLNYKAGEDTVFHLIEVEKIRHKRSKMAGR